MISLTSHMIYDETEHRGRLDSSLPVKPRKKKKKPPSARRRARRRQQRFLEKKAAEKATSPKRSVSQATIPKEPESVAKELNLSPEIRDQERADQSVLVESETSSETSNSAPLDDQTSDVSLLASIQEEQEIFTDFLAANIDSDDDFGDTGVCANCNREPKEGTELERCTRRHITRYCSTDCQQKDWGFNKFACSVVAKRAPTKTLLRGSQF